MGTRADFYVGRGKNAEWIGSIAWDGYPGGNPKSLLKIKDEQQYRSKVAKLLNNTADCGPTKLEMGWPWPWKNSDTTDYAYAFDSGRVWGTCFGCGWWPADKEPEEHDEGKDIEWPNMSTKKAAPAGSNRSGIMVLTVKK